jgi:hypothetical protein
MPMPPLRKALIPSLVLSCTVFSSLTLPLAVFGSELLVIQIQKEPIFVGKLKDVAAPYLGVATAFSLGTGIAGLAVCGWRQSSRKTVKLSEQVSDLQQQLISKESYIEELKLAEPRLQAVGLGAFLEETLEESSPLSSNVTRKHSQPIEPPMPSTIAVESIEVAHQPLQAVHQVGHTANHLEVQQMQEQLAALQQQLKQKELQLLELKQMKVKVQAAELNAVMQNVPFAVKSPATERKVAVDTPFVKTAQAIVDKAQTTTPSLETKSLSYKHALPAIERATTSMPGSASATLALQALAEVGNLQSQLEQIMSQIQVIQSSLSSELQPETDSPDWADNPDVVLQNLSQRVQHLEALWTRQRISSDSQSVRMMSA